MNYKPGPVRTVNRFVFYFFSRFSKNNEGLLKLFFVDKHRKSFNVSAAISFDL